MTVASSALVAALEAAYRAIQENNPEVPDAVILLASGRRPRGGVKHGHFWAEQFRVGQLEPCEDAGESSSACGKCPGCIHNAALPVSTPEVLIATETLNRGAVAVIGTLIHEAAHAANYVKGIKDTSGQGNRYHNKHFKSMAEGLGLDISRAKGLGWSLTSVPMFTQDVYAEAIQGIQDALKLHKGADVHLKGKGKSADRNYIKCVCMCEHVIRCSKTTLEAAAGAIVCTQCNTPFMPEDPTKIDWSL